MDILSVWACCCIHQCTWRGRGGYLVFCFITSHLIPLKLALSPNLEPVILSQASEKDSYLSYSSSYCLKNSASVLKIYMMTYSLFYPNNWQHGFLTISMSELYLKTDPFLPISKKPTTLGPLNVSLPSELQWNMLSGNFYFGFRDNSKEFSRNYMDILDR